MIPEFDDNGHLPPGIHPATLDEIEARFGQESEIRRVEMESVRWLVDLAKRAGATRLVINGRFVTDALEPNDVDCVLLFEEGQPRDSALEAELAAGLPFLQIEMANQSMFDFFVQSFYASDRQGISKGMIEVAL
ncbi:MAG: hypothetical protein K2R98_07835 [Gemmataceae bacterium]|nr:hypothetical protein [Gemmataceae bacterium]